MKGMYFTSLSYLITYREVKPFYNMTYSVMARIKLEISNEGKELV